MHGKVNLHFIVILWTYIFYSFCYVIPYPKFRILINYITGYYWYQRTSNASVKMIYVLVYTTKAAFDVYIIHGAVWSITHMSPLFMCRWYFFHTIMFYGTLVSLDWWLLKGLKSHFHIRSITMIKSKAVYTCFHPLISMTKWRDTFFTRIVNHDQIIP